MTSDLIPPNSDTRIAVVGLLAAVRESDYPENGVSDSGRQAAGLVNMVDESLFGGNGKRYA